MSMLQQNQMETIGRVAALNASVAPDKAVEIVKKLIAAAAMSEGPANVTVELTMKAAPAGSVSIQGIPCLSCVCITTPFGKICECVLPPGGGGC